MIITSLVRKRSDVELVFDNGNKVSLDYRVVYDNGLRKYDNVSEDELKSFLYKSELLQIRDAAFRLLARRLHSTHELKLKLIKKKYDKLIIDNVIQSLKEENYLNDDQFAKLLTEEKYVKKKFGKNKIRAELYKKGIDKSVIDSILNNQDDELNYDNAIFLAKKKLKFLNEKKTDKKKLKEKLYSFLSRKGYDSELIMKVINNMNFDSSDIEIC